MGLNGMGPLNVQILFNKYIGGKFSEICDNLKNSPMSYGA